MRMSNASSTLHGLDNDCLIVIFAHLPLPEKFKCRLVCRQWAACIDKLLIGQQHLEIYGGNRSAVAAAAEASGVLHHSRAGGGGLLARILPARIARTLRHLWWRLNLKLSPSETGPSGDLSPRLPSTGLGSPSDHDYLDSQVEPSPSVQLYDESSGPRTTPVSALDLIHLSSYYWTYAFCSSSSLFSSYSFANSRLTTHDYHHSFCACYARERYKYSLLIDRATLSLELLCKALAKFGNIQHLVIRNLDQLSDVLLLLITTRCRKLNSLTFINCTSLGEDDSHNRHAQLNRLTDYGWSLLSQTYSRLTSLTLRQCRLSELQLTQVIKSCHDLRFLDISDNACMGKSVRYLGPSIECLICGNLSNDESLDKMLSNVAFGNGRHLKSLAMFGALASLKAFVEFDRLTSLELHFYTDEELPNYLGEIGCLSLESLVLEQIRCYECPSAISAAQFETMLTRSSKLERLQITGDFDWNLRLVDDSLQRLAERCPQLKELTINGNGSLTDYGVLHLSSLPLTQLSLSSFQTITDYSIKTLMRKVPSLEHVTLVDMPQVSDRVILKAIDVCKAETSRKINLTLSDEQMSRRIRRRHLVYPPNLTVHFDGHLCGKELADAEPTDVQMVLVVLMSAIILGMTLLTTVVVVLVPLSMLFMMAHEYIFDTLLTCIDSFNILDVRKMSFTLFANVDVVEKLEIFAGIVLSVARRFADNFVAIKA